MGSGAMGNTEPLGIAGNAVFLEEYSISREEFIDSVTPKVHPCRFWLRAGDSTESARIWTEIDPGAGREHFGQQTVG